MTALSFCVSLIANSSLAHYKQFRQAAAKLQKPAANIIFIEKMRNYALISPTFVENGRLFPNHLTACVF